jgi:capsular exopolysaccharide synthesis family protein
VQELSRKLDAARADLTQTLVVYGKSHPKARQLQAQVDEMQAQLASQQNRVVSNMRTSFAAARSREDLLNKELRSASGQLGQVSQYEALKKTAEANEQLYNSLYAKVKEAAIGAEAKTSNIRWVEHAPVLNRPTRPNRLLDILAAIVAGLVGGVLLAFVREKVDNRLHTIEDVRFSTGLPSVSLVPLMAGVNGRTSSTAQLMVPGATLVLLQRPNSPEAEALRGLFTSVSLCSPGRTPQVLLIASSAPAEGKTTIATNLAVALARTRKTCIVDADLRKPGLARVFGVKHARGLAELLCGAARLDEALVPVPRVPNLNLLPAGTVAGTAGELLTPERMARVLQDLRQRFDAVVVDSPPIIPYADARAISPLADGVIIVGRAGVTTREALRRSLELLREVHSAPVLDVVLNAVPHTSPDYGYHYGYSGNT